MNTDIDHFFPNESAHVTPKPGGRPEQLSLRFTGSGWEYFRIWAVNLALMLITLGIYYPWARVRKLRYIYANTLVDGDALTYHANGLQLFKGMVIAGVAFGVINILGTVWPVFAAFSGLAFWLAVPWLWCMAMRFRLRQTSWRGLRFQFTGSVGWAYATLGGGGLLVLAVIFLAIVALGVLEGADTGPAAMVWVAVLGALALGVAWSALVLWTRRYQHQHYAWGDLGVRMEVSLREVLAVSAAGAGVAALLFAAVVALGVLGAGAAALTSQARDSAAVSVVLAVVGSLYLLFPLLAAYLGARYQNLFWGATHNEHLCFRSHLSPWAYVGRVLLNIVLTALTLGLYWPFAAMAITRMRVQAMAIESAVDWSTVHAVAGQGQGSLGDMAMEMEGVDFGF